MNDSILVKVTNRDSGSTGYKLPDSGIRRTFAPRETKQIPLEELKKLQYIPGGEFLLKHLLIVNDADALSALNMEVEPEYFYTEDTIKELLLTGSMDQLEDTLNFAPEGVIDLIKKISVDIELPDMRKREMISKKTGFNIHSAITVNQVVNAESAPEVSKEPAPVRKASAPSAPVRKTTPKYNVVTPLE